MLHIIYDDDEQNLGNHLDRELGKLVNIQVFVQTDMHEVLHVQL